MANLGAVVSRFCFASFCLLGAGCGEESASRVEAAMADDAVRIVAHQVLYEREQTNVEVVGTARARASATIYPESTGEVTEVLFSAGDFVEANQPLVRLDSREEQLAVELAQVAVRDAEQRLARYTQIEGVGAFSVSVVDETRIALDTATIELEQAQVALEERTIVAPFTGYTGISDVDVGARVTSTTVITQLDERESLYVDFALPEQVFGQLRVGDAVNLTSFAEAGGLRQAEIVAIDSRIDPMRRTFTARAEIENTDDGLRPGMSFRVLFSIPGQAYPAVPEAAVVWGGSGSYVWRVVEGLAERTPVTIVARIDGRALVQGRIPEGSLVVAEGVQKVREGTPVAPISSPPVVALGEGS